MTYSSESVQNDFYHFPVDIQIPLEGLEVALAAHGYHLEIVDSKSPGECLVRISNEFDGGPLSPMYDSND